MCRELTHNTANVSLYVPGTAWTISAMTRAQDASEPESGQEPTPQPGPAPSAHDRARKIATVFSLVFLSFQVIVPLLYYVGPRDYDERFSWRMFSTVRLRDCQVQVSETLHDTSGTQVRPVAIERDVQVAWVKLLERMRDAVVDKYLERRCEREHVVQVQYVGRCNDTDGTALPALERVMHCNREATP